MTAYEQMRDALVAMLDEKCRQCYINDQICTQGLECHWNGKRGEICQDGAIDKAEAALAESPRNCDVGTARQQLGRFMKLCRSFPECAKCPYHRCVSLESCVIKWAQMPYEEGGDR